MARKIKTKNNFFYKNLKYETLLANLFVNRILKNGKKQLAYLILTQTLKQIESKTNKTSLIILEKAVRNASPTVKLKTKRIGGATHQIPVILTKIQSINSAIRWLIQAARKRMGKGMPAKLAIEIIEAAKGVGSVIKKKEETHKMAEANKTFLEIL